MKKYYISYNSSQVLWENKIVEELRKKLEEFDNAIIQDEKSLYSILDIMVNSVNEVKRVLKHPKIYVSIEHEYYPHMIFFYVKRKVKDEYIIYYKIVIIEVDQLFYVDSNITPQNDYSTNYTNIPAMDGEPIDDLPF